MSSKLLETSLHSEAMSHGELDAAALVREIVEEARKTVGSGPRLAERLEDLGIGPETGRYSESAVSNWIKGRTMPPGDVVLAAAWLAGISIDSRLLATAEAANAAADWQEAVEELQVQIEALQAQIIEVCGRLGVPVPALGVPPSPPRATTG